MGKVGEQVKGERIILRDRRSERDVRSVDGF